MMILSNLNPCFKSLIIKFNFYFKFNQERVNVSEKFVAPFLFDDLIGFSNSSHESISIGIAFRSTAH